MSISIPQPSMVVASEHAYSHRIGDVRIPYATREYQMWNTWKVADSVLLEHIVDRVAAVADSAPDHYLRVLVITAHALPGFIGLGQGIVRKRPKIGVARARGIAIGDLPVLAKWRDKVANIWIVACNVAHKSPGHERDGNLFCCALAKTTGAYVVASTDDQTGDMIPLPWGHVDDWEGLVRRYEPEHGSVDWHYQYPLGLAADVGFAVRHSVVPPIAVPPRFRARMGGPGAFFLKEPEPLRRLPKAPRTGIL